jgi:glutamate-1-semialdehyde aminotransferase
MMMTMMMTMTMTMTMMMMMITGVTHDIRYLDPFPVYFSHAQGSAKTCVDGRRYIDLWMGHGNNIMIINKG